MKGCICHFTKWQLHPTWGQRWIIVGPASQTVGQQWCDLFATPENTNETQHLLSICVYYPSITCILWGAGMIASSSTFRPHPGRVIRDLFSLLNAILHGSTSLQQTSKGSCSLLVSSHNLREYFKWRTLVPPLVSSHNLPADCQWGTLVPSLNSGANAAPASVLTLMQAVVALNNHDNRQ